MRDTAKVGLPILGIIFLALAVLKFVQGGNWVVWAVLGILFGGLRVFGFGHSSGGDHAR